MKVITFTRWELIDDMFVVVEERSRNYAGPWALVKKGRERLEKNAEADAAAAAAAREKSTAQYGRVTGFENEETGSTTPGTLSPAATAQLAADRDQIANTYNGIRQTAFRTMGQRGFGSAPSGFTAAAANAADLGEATQDTAAYRNAQVQTEQQRQHAANLAAGLTGTEGSLGNTASGESTNAAYDRSKAGSTIGDITGAVANVAPIVAAPFTGGASLAAYGIPGFSRIGSKPKSPGDVGTYDPSTSGSYPG